MNQTIKQTFGPIVLICLCALAVYANVLNGSFQFDDEEFIIFNHRIKGLDLDNLRMMYSYYSGRIVTFVTFAINYALNYYDEFGYHLFNVIIHMATGVCVWWFVLLFFRAREETDAGSEDMPRRVAFWAALIFVVHPVQTQAVAYITQRFESLAALFYISSVCAYMVARLTERKRRMIAGFAASALLAVLGMMTKEVVITLPLMIILIEIFLFQQGTVRWTSVLDVRRWTGRIIWLLLLVSLIVPFHMGWNVAGQLFQTKMSASHFGDVITFDKYVLTQFRVLAVFLKLMVFPIGQTLDYDFPLSPSVWEPATWMSMALVFIVGWTALALRQKWFPVFFGVLWFFVTFLPNFVPREHVIFEHKLYLTSIGLCFAAAYVIDRFISDAKIRRGVFIAIVCVLALVAINRNRVWQNPIALWTDGVKKSPDKPRPWMNLGTAYYRDEQYEEALVYLNKAIEMFPDYHKALSVRGMTYLKLEEYNKALADLNRAIAMNSENLPARYIAHRANVHYDMKQYREALRDISYSLYREPHNESYFRSRGMVWDNLGLYHLAVWDFSQAIRLQPKFAEAYNSRAKTWITLGKLDAAEQDVKAALLLNSDIPETYDTLGTIYGRRGDYKTALSHFNTCLDLNADEVNCLLNRGFLYSLTGKATEAMRDLNRVLVLDPDSAEGYFKRGNVNNDLGNYDRAVNDFRRAITIEPDFADAYNNLAAAYYFQKEYAKGWEIIQTAAKRNLPLKKNLVQEFQRQISR